MVIIIFCDSNLSRFVYFLPTLTLNSDNRPKLSYFVDDFDICRHTSIILNNLYEVGLCSDNLCRAWLYVKDAIIIFQAGLAEAAIDSFWYAVYTHRKAPSTPATCWCGRGLRLSYATF